MKLQSCRRNIVPSFSSWSLCLSDVSPHLQIPGQSSKTRQEVFACLKCPKIYNHHRSLVRHLRLECGQEAQFSCPHCPYRAKQRNNVKLHINAEVQVSFLSEAVLPSKNAFMNTLLTSQVLLTMNSTQAFKPPNPHKCTNCGRTYKYRENLARHLRQECGIEPMFAYPQRYMCDQCGRTYKRKGTLLEHTTLICNKEPQFSCSLCPYKCHTRRRVKRHVLTQHFS
ncbi:zinc finger protein 37-like [Macrosteles quadrilineatus]|uniref:zinc finger protein 37-like n=1 Tax=Macrosteles quadrilineatus TaxID=74068 RepID=UPI0023E1A1BE|nr:zinc finger protein 37-like [Macrosteles quadrilineatus]